MVSTTAQTTSRMAPRRSIGPNPLSARPGRWVTGCRNSSAARRRELQDRVQLDRVRRDSRLAMRDVEEADPGDGGPATEFGEPAGGGLTAGRDDRRAGARHLPLLR